MMNRKSTAWKKNRKFGEIHGGRTQRKIPDNIFQRAHSLKRPAPTEETPILIQYNPSRDYYFPISAEEANTAMQALPEDHVRAITHIWLRRKKHNDDVPFAEFVCGSGVRAIILYPWPKDNLLRFGRLRPLDKQLREYSQWTTDLIKKNGNWCLRWNEEALRHMYIRHLLYHEVGHHIDWYCQYWSNANHKQVEDFADQYAVSWSKTATEVYNHLEEKKET